LKPRNLPAKPLGFVFGLTLAVAAGGLRLNAIFAALQLSPLAVVHSLLSGSPVLVMILSHFLLKRGQDPFTAAKAMASCLLIVGVTLISDPISAVKDAVCKKAKLIIFPVELA